MLLEELAFLEDLFHCHARDDDSSLALNDALDDILNIVSRRMGGAALAARFSREQKGVFLEGGEVVVWADGEDCRKRKLEFLDGHSLQVKGKVEGRDGNTSTL